MQLPPTTASKQKKRTTQQQLVNTASTYGTATTTTTTTTASLKSYQLSFLNTEMVVYIILDSSKAFCAIFRCFFDIITLYNMSFAMLFLSGSVLSATSH
ncbi:hypothetical protein PS6_008199 [Mucor atramentarius]